jgi:predicted  nucleic acid-binding Zn-ribbon protein
MNPILEALAEAEEKIEEARNTVYRATRDVEEEVEADSCTLPIIDEAKLALALLIRSLESRLDRALREEIAYERSLESFRR